MVFSDGFRPLRRLWEFAQGALHVLLPAHCLGCGRVLFADERQICLHCKVRIARTYFERAPRANPIHRRLAPLFPLEAAYARYVYEGPIKAVIHELKYGGRPMAAEYFGKELGEGLQQMWTPSELPDVIIPVPLHPRKQLQRGYNQSLQLAKGVSAVLRRPVKQWIRRRRYTVSQTRMDMAQRWDNMAKAFEADLSKRDRLRSFHALIVDDVITTGATIAACAQALAEAAPSVRISVAALATPMHR